MPYIGLLDTSGIQQYVFRSPELKEIAAASGFIEALGDTQGGLIAQEARNAGAELFIAAGGNAALLAPSDTILKNAFRAISRELLVRGDGLQIVCAIEQYRDGEMAAGYLHALRRLERHKGTQPRDTAFVFPGCERAEPESAPPAFALPPLPAWQVGFTEPRNFTNLICDGFRDGEKEETDLMAVVSVDGIGMGKRVIQWMNNQAAAQDDPTFRREFPAWSQSIKQRWAEAWDAARAAAAHAFPRSGNFTLAHTQEPKRTIRLKTDPKSNTGEAFLPMRRIFQGGDDLCFVCDARVALSLTSLLMRALEKKETNENVPEVFRVLTAGAGIVFVDSHFPFARAVALADMVQKNAKKRAAHIAEETGTSPSVLDWWVNRQGALTRPEPPYAGVSLKPYPLHTTYRDCPFTWNDLESTILPELKTTFAGSRNKLKDVLIAAEESKATVERLLALRPLDERKDKQKPFFFLPSPPFDHDTGFETGGTRTVLRDTGELFDIHFPLPDQSGQSEEG